MIIQEYGKYKLICDMCDDYLDFDTFEDAVKHMKKEGWGSFNHDGIWENYCPECLDNIDY